MQIIQFPLPISRDDNSFFINRTERKQSSQSVKISLVVGGMEQLFLLFCLLDLGGESEDSRPVLAAHRGADLARRDTQ